MWKHILIAEDDPDTADVLRQALTERLDVLADVDDLVARAGRLMGGATSEIAV